MKKILFVALLTLAMLAYASGKVSATSVIVDNPAFTFSGAWSTGGLPNPIIGTTETYSNQAGAYAEYSFYGNSVTLYLTRQNNRGIAEIKIDGAVVATVDSYYNTATATAYNALYQNLPLGNHTLRVTVTGNKNISSSGAYVTIDGLTYNDGAIPSATPTQVSGNFQIAQKGIYFSAPYTYSNYGWLNCSQPVDVDISYVYCYGNASGQDSQSVIAGLARYYFGLKNNNAYPLNIYYDLDFISVSNGLAEFINSANGVLLPEGYGVFTLPANTNYLEVQGNISTSESYVGELGGSVFVELASSPSLLSGTPTPTPPPTSAPVVIVTPTAPPTVAGDPTSPPAPVTPVIIATVPTDTPYQPTQLPDEYVTPYLYVTPTALSFECPLNQPIGYGAVTPSYLWLSSCSQCLAYVGTSTPRATPTIDLTTTATPNLTPTATALPGDLLFISHSTANYTYTAIDSDTSVCDVSAGTTTKSVTCTGTITGRDLTNVIAGKIRHVFQFRSAVAQGTTLYYTLDANSFSGSEVVYEPAKSGSINLGSGTTEIYIDVNQTIPYTGGMSLSYTATFSNYEGASNNLSYCGVINGGLDFNSGFSFELFRPIGNSNCAIGWAETKVLSYTLPAFRICLQPVLIGYVELFGYSFQGGTLALAAVAAFSFRFLKVI